MQITIDSRLLIAATLCQANNDVRYYLNAICLRENRLSSTNGHYLFDCELDEGITGKLKETKISFNDSIKGFKGFVTIDLENKVAISENKKAVTFELIDGKFPDIDRVLPKSNRKKGKGGTFNSSYIELACKVIHAVHGKNEGMRFNLGENPNDTVSITSVNPEFKFELLVMPIRT